jgi:hypothetical protein
MVASSSSALMKRCPGHPLGSKNKPKPPSSLANRSVDANDARHNASPPPVNLFSFFAIAGAQCREQQRVPLKLGKSSNKRRTCDSPMRRERVRRINTDGLDCFTSFHRIFSSKLVTTMHSRSLTFLT